MNSSILWYLSWPLLIFISYRVVLIALKYFEKNLKKKQAVASETEK
jgi:hypothetical protein